MKIPLSILLAAALVAPPCALAGVIPPERTVDWSVAGYPGPVPSPTANLFEVNVVASIIIDQYWGRGGPYNTFFRNQLEWYGFIITPDNPTSDQNVVGNALEKRKSNPLLSFVYTL